MATNKKNITNEETNEFSEEINETAEVTKESELELKFKELEAKYNALLMAMAGNLNNQPVQTANNSNEVTLVYLSDSLGVVFGTNITLNCTRFGEEFVLSRTQFDEIVGKYRKWFDDGILAVSYKNVDVAAAKGLLTDKEYKLNMNLLKKIGSMNEKELEKLWEDTKEENHRLSIVTYFKRKFIENVESGYRDRAKIDLLNRLTNGGFARESVELSGNNLKIRPTEMN